MVLEIGDRMRFSVQLIEQIRRKGGPEQTTELLIIQDISEDGDGCKTVWLSRAKEPE